MCPSLRGCHPDKSSSESMEHNQTHQQRLWRVGKGSKNDFVEVYSLAQKHIYDSVWQYAHESLQPVKQIHCSSKSPAHFDKSFGSILVDQFSWKMQKHSEAPYPVLVIGNKNQQNPRHAHSCPWVHPLGSMAADKCLLNLIYKQRIRTEHNLKFKKMKNMHVIT